MTIHVFITRIYIYICSMKGTAHTRSRLRYSLCGEYIKTLLCMCVCILYTFAKSIIHSTGPIIYTHTHTEREYKIIAIKERYLRTFHLNQCIGCVEVMSWVSLHLHMYVCIYIYVHITSYQQLFLQVIPLKICRYTHHTTHIYSYSNVRVSVANIILFGKTLLWFLIVFF